MSETEVQAAIDEADDWMNNERGRRSHQEPEPRQPQDQDGPRRDLHLHPLEARMKTRRETERKIRAYIETCLNPADDRLVAKGASFEDDILLGDLKVLLPEEGKSSLVEAAIDEADEWLNSHRVSETWRTMSRLRDTLVRVSK